MAQIDWEDLTGGALDSASVARGVSNAFVRPPSTAANNFVYGLRTLVSTTGTAGKYCNITNFQPIAGSKKGGSMSVAMKKFTAGTSYAPFFGFMKDTNPTSANAQGYFLALTQETSYKIGLFKGSPASGFAASATHLLDSSDATFTAVGDAVGGWFHLRLDILVNPHSEVVINVYQNDLTANNVDAPSWAAITGISRYMDDSLGYFTGTGPYLDGFYPIFGMYTAQGSGELCLFDHMTIGRQLTP